MTYQDCLLYFNSFINYEKIIVRKKGMPYRLNRFKAFLKFLDNPQNTLRCVHVAGSKGKGSVCAFTANILKEAGFKVGFYTSPHLTDIRERIRILTPFNKDKSNVFNGIITKKEFVRLIEFHKPKIEAFCKNSGYGRISFFEFITAIAFIYFNKKRVDFAVIETGMGGRLDATNTVKALVNVITPISYEHMYALGNTLKKIAKEKSAIIKNKSSVVCIDKPKDALGVIRQRCKKVKAELFIVNKDILFKGMENNFFISGILGKYNKLKISLIGEHQLVNASLAVGAVECLQKKGINIELDKIKRGLYNTIWPGRCEVIQRRPLVILDGAQNVASVKALIKTVLASFKFSRIILVLGISQDKDITGICNQLRRVSDKVILTCADNPRATQPEKLAKYFRQKDLFITSDVKEARRKAIKLAQKDDLVLVTGSLFLIGEYRQ